MALKPGTIRYENIGWTGNGGEHENYNCGCCGSEWFRMSNETHKKGFGCYKEWKEDLKLPS